MSTIFRDGPTPKQSHATKSKWNSVRSGPIQIVFILKVAPGMALSYKNIHRGMFETVQSFPLCQMFKGLIGRALVQDLNDIKDAVEHK